MNESDYKFAGAPWVSGGRDWKGADCVGIVQLFLSEIGFQIDVPERENYEVVAAELLHGKFFQPMENLERGDVLFFAQKGVLAHVGVWLGDGKFLHSVMGGSRIDNGLTLLLRAGAKWVGTIKGRDAASLCTALKIPTLGGPLIVIPLVLIAISLAASFALRPKIPNFGEQFGRYSANGGFPLATLTSTEVPLPDLLGDINLAGNAVYQTPIDKSLTITDPTQQKINRVVVFATAPGVSFLLGRVNNVATSSPFYGQETQGGVTLTGFLENPGSDAEAVDGTVAGYSTKFPSFTVYKGDYDTEVPLDRRAKFDRNFPVYGFSGCIYAVYRFIDSTKFANGLNVSARISGHAVRTFTSTGFEKLTSNDSWTADGTRVRFKARYYDLENVTSVTVGGVAYTEIGPGNQTGNVYHVNKTKGYFEFLTAPGSGVSILASYSYFNRAFSQNPAGHIVYMLTEKIRGKGFDESKINWPAAVALRDYCDENVSWNTSRGIVTGPRYRTNYVLDVRRPLGEHIRALLDACHAQLFLSGGKIVMKAKKAGSSVFSFNESNILVEKGADGVARSTFVSQLVDRTQRANRVHVFYHAYETFNSETGVVRDDGQSQEDRAPRVGNDGVVEEVLKYRAVDSESQAERLAELILQEDVNANWAIELRTTVKGLALEPGDLIDVTHSSQPLWNQKMFWVEEISQDENDYMVIRGAEYYEPAYL